MFNKPKRNIRRRNVDEEEDNHNKQLDSENAFSSKRDKPKKLKKPKQTLLSFGEELDEADDGEVFKVKKSSRSRRLMKQLDQERKRKKSEDKFQDDFDCLTTKNQENSLQIETDDLVVKIKNSGVSLFNDQDIISGGQDSYSSEEDSSIGGHKYQNKSSAPANMKLILESGCIPDASMIHAARKRRQQARESGQEYIPVEEQRDEDNGFKLIHQVDPDVSDGDSDEERISMTIDSDTKEKENRRQAFINAQATTEKMSDEENAPDDEWEQQQIRKGVTRAQLSANQTPMSHHTAIRLEQISCLEQSMTCDSISVPLLPVTLDSLNDSTVNSMNILSKLRERLIQIREVHRRHEVNYQAVLEELNQCRIEMAEGEAQTPQIAHRYEYYQDLRTYINNLIDCFNEKIPTIATLESDWIELQEERSSFLIERRRQDIRDQVEEINNIQRGQFGRKGIENDTHIRRATEREGRKSRRRKTRETSSFLQRHIDGMSSDDEVTEQQNIAFMQNKVKIEKNSQEVFLDVEDSFCNAKAVLNKFLEWKTRDLESYTEAYVSLCIPKIISPIVRLQLITWNPLTENSEFEKMKWFNSIEMLSNQSSDSPTENSSGKDPDSWLISASVEKIILPKLTTMATKIWDPMSTSQTLRFIGVVNRILKQFLTLNRSSKQFNELFTAIVDKMKNSLENDIFIPIFSKQVADSRHQFFQRQLTMAIKLLRNFLSWQNLIEDETLQDIAIISLLNRYLLTVLRVMPPVEAIIKANMIMSTLPRVWLQGKTIEPLKMFGILIEELSMGLDQANPSHNEAWNYANSILKIIKPSK